MEKKGQWYDKCGRAPWQPPSIAFRIVWPILYALYAATLYLERDNIEARNYLLVGLLLNLCWVPLFTFNISLALILLTAMIAVAAKCMMLMKNRVTFYLFAPYLAWICFAWTLNAYLAVTC
jgi:tryptophan-rich sensory protein